MNNLYKKSSKLGVILLLLSVFFPYSGILAQETSLSLNPTDDAHLIGGSNADINYGATDPLQVKSAGDAGGAGSRKAYLKFDLTTVPSNKKINEAKLKLYTAAWTTGATCTFHLYGLMDGAGGDAPDGWSESEITWNNAPGNDKTSHFGFDENVVLLDNVTFSNTISSGESVMLSSAKLNSFLNADQNDRITLMISRSTVTWNFNTNFYSKENNVFAPVLELVLTEAGSSPASPSNLATNLSSPTKVKLTWTDNSDNEQGFRIERKIEEGDFEQVAEVGPDLTEYEDDGLAISTTYTYRVRAFNSDGNSEYSNESIVYTMDHTVLSVIINTSYAIMPGTHFSIRGESLNGNSRVVVNSSDGPAPAEPPVGATELTIVQSDRDNRYLVVEFPGSMSPGVYDLWIDNGNGWSTPVKLNEPRPKFISEYQAFDGLDIYLVGRNFSAPEFGIPLSTEVRLNDGNGGIFTVDVLEVNPYAVKFKIGSQPAGEYWVEVRNDTKDNWVRLENDEVQKLEIIPAGEDPLGLGVVWAAMFNWSNEIDVTSKGAVPNDENDDTQAIQSAVNDIATSGGGVVYLPNGTYLCSHIDLPENVVLKGQDRGSTIMTYNGAANAQFISASGSARINGKLGVAQLTLTLSDDNVRPDAFLWLGQGWGEANSDKAKRTAENIFIFDVGIDYGVNYPGTPVNRGIGAIIIANKRILLKNNRFVGYYAQLNRAYVNSYATISDNYFEYSKGVNLCTADYTIMTDNNVVGHPEVTGDPAGRLMQGLDYRSLAYVYNNIVEKIGSEGNNDGEALLVEHAQQYFNFGEVAGASSNSLVVTNPMTGLTMPVVSYGNLVVQIVHGKGLGQHRRVTGISGNTINVAKGWNIIPDHTSKWTLIAAFEHVTCYRNKIKDTEKGIWFYGDVIDGVAADNFMENTEGIFSYSAYAPNDSQGKHRFVTSYYFTARGNEAVGVSPLSKHTNIGVLTTREDAVGTYFGVENYGFEARDNNVKADLSLNPIPATEAPAQNGIFAYAADLKSRNDGLGLTGDVTNVLVENNQLKEMETGITIKRNPYGQVVGGNIFNNVTTAMNIVGENTNDLETQFSDKRGPYWEAGHALTVTDVKANSLMLNWENARDFGEVAIYRIYQGDQLLASVGSSVTGFKVTGLRTETVYSFSVEATDAANNVSSGRLNLTQRTGKQDTANKSINMPSGDLTMRCYPNPFSSVLSISYTLPEKRWIKLRVYNITGEELMVLAEGFQNPGTYQVVLNGDILPKHGAYVIRLNDRNNSIAEKVIYAKKP
jgi:hypothetical protein